MTAPTGPKGRRLKPAAGEVEPDEVYGARIVAGLVCACGLPNPPFVAPGSDGVQVNLLGEDEDCPGRVFALTRERPARGWCLSCWPWAQRRPVETMECAYAAG